jgi:hypothetical protein
MKRKFKPVAKLEIRERVEARFRARGSLRFHLLLVVGALLVLLYNAFNFWFLWDDFQSFGFVFNSYRDSITALCLLSTSATLHLIHYQFRHGRVRDRHDAETDWRIDERLRGAAADEADEQEALVRLQQADKLKNFRLTLWHLALYVGIMCWMVLVHPMNAGGFFRYEPEIWQAPLTLAGIWGIGLGAHLLRYASAYGTFGEKREGKIDQMVERELRRNRRERQAGTDARVGEGGGVSLADLDRVSQVRDSAAQEAP